MITAVVWSIPPDSTKMAARLKIYMFGYWGWGGTTEQLVKSIDAVERKRGFKPPIFADIRIHRSVRAVGFSNNAFELTVGRRRYRWIPELGNLSALARSKSSGIHIKSPKTAVNFLAFAKECARVKRHVIFFCSCEYPRWCHRYAVARLLIRAARRENLALEIAEWPGNEPKRAAIILPDPVQKTSPGVRLGLYSTRPLWKFGGLAFGTKVRFSSEDESKIVSVAPVRFARTGPYLPVLQDDDGNPVRATGRAIGAWRRRRGYTSLLSMPK